MANILFLAHRIPYPPNKGDKIRSWHVLEHFLKSHKVHLGCFLDDPADERYCEFLRAKVASSYFAKITKFGQKLSALKGFVTGESLSVAAYPKTRLQAYVNTVLERENIDFIYVFSGAMMKFTPQLISSPNSGKDIPIVLDMVDVDSTKWSDYAKLSKAPLSWIYRREAELLFQYEGKATEIVYQTFFVSDSEAALFNQLTDRRFENKVSSFENGVNLKQFNPEIYEPDQERIKAVILFTGAMDYRPNIEAVLWFAANVWPQIKTNAQKDIIFRIAGGPVASSVRALGTNDSIEVRGYVDDMAQEIAAADVVVAPLRTARGIQNKVLEGMAMARAVVATSLANEGIDAEGDKNILLADAADDFADCVTSLLSDSILREEIGESARQFIEENFTWDNALAKLDKTITAILENET
jgi:sugar transferase (PEP-CTERM/EpsH1 system associated)